VSARRRGLPRDGFTLIELVIAFGVLAVGLLSMLMMQLHALRGGASGRFATEAAAVARDRMERLQRVDFDGPELDDTDASPGPPAGWTSPVQVLQVVRTDQDEVLQSYALQWRVDDVNPQLKSIDLRVTWDEPNRPGRSFAISSLRHDDP